MLSKLELLKIDLMANGMGITERAKQDLTQGGKIPLSLFEYATTSGIPLRFQNSDIYVNSPFAEDFCQGANWQLDSRDGSFFVARDGEEERVEPIPLPSYFNTRWGQFAMTHTDRVRISPIAGCSFSCQFCDLSRTSKYRKKNVEDLIESIRVALADSDLPAKHILISGGNPKPQDEKKDSYDGITKTPLNKELEDLTKKNILKSKQKGNREIYYSINLDQICKRFLEYIEKLIKQRYDNTFYIMPSKYKENEILKELLKISLETNYEEFKRKGKNIRPMGLMFEEIFYQLIYYLSPHDFLDNELLKKKGMKEFCELSEIIYNPVVRDRQEGYDQFWTKYFSLN